jgi:site-specific DNA-cytosine methylase
LWEIVTLEPLPERYYLSARQAAGILERTARPKGSIPNALAAALGSTANPDAPRQTPMPSHGLRRNTQTPFTVSDVGTTRATVLVVDTEGRARILTPEEWELCHGFPRGWTEAAGSDAHRWALLGNAVSPPVAWEVGAGILDAQEA